jgi:hypothetical protein
MYPIVVCRRWLVISTGERPVQAVAAAFPPALCPHFYGGARAGGKAITPAVSGRRGAQISSERRPVALADVAVYVGGRRAACRRKMGAVTLGDCRCQNGATVPPLLAQGALAGTQLVKDKKADGSVSLHRPW